MGFAHFLPEDFQALGGLGPERMIGDIVRDLQLGDVVIALDDKIRHIGRTVFGVQDFPTAEQLCFPANVEQAPHVVVPVALPQFQLADRNVFALRVILPLRHAELARSLVEQIAKDGDAWRRRAVEGGFKDLERSHGVLPAG